MEAPAAGADVVAVAAAPAPPLPLDPTRLPVTIVSLLLAALGLAGWAVGSRPAENAGFLLFALVGFGSAWLVVLRRSALPVLALSAPVGMAFVVLTGFALVETRSWQASRPVFIVAFVAALVVHAGVLVDVARPRGAHAAPDGAGHRNGTNDNNGANGANGSGGTSGATVANGSTVVAVTPATQRAERRVLAVVAALSVVAVLACAGSALAINNFDPTKPSGLLGHLSPVWYAGMALGAVAVMIGLGVNRSGAVSALRRATFAVPVIGLQLAIALTPALAYTQPRYAWTSKHLGVTSYILLHGSVDPKIDIYQAWPGLFAGVAWVCHGIGLSNPVAVARWWPTVIDVALVLVFQRLALRAIGDVRRSWMAAVILMVGNTIGQDYFSPQATGFLLALAIFAVIFARRGERRGMSASTWAVLVGMVLAVAVTHQLTPYLVFGVTVVLLVFGQIRSRLAPIVVVVPAVVWALVHLSVVKRYLGVGQFGNVVKNIQTRGIVNTAIHKSFLIRLDSYALAGDALLIGVIAVIVLLQRRSRSHVAFALCAASGAGLFVANSYGNEGAFRVVLFAVPWLAILVADWDFTKLRLLRWVPLTIVPVLLGLLLFSNMGLDYINAVRSGDVSALQTFNTTAPAGSRLFVFGKGYAPVRSSGHYNLYRVTSYPYVTPPRGSALGNPQFVVYKQFMHAYVTPLSIKKLRKSHFYALFAAQPEANLHELHLVSASEYRALDTYFRNTPNWVMVTQTSTATLYRLDSYFFDKARPNITGHLMTGAVVTATTGSWPSLNPLKFTYQWELCRGPDACFPVAGATHKSYRLRPTDAGTEVDVVVTATDTKGNGQVATAKPTATVRKPRTVLQKTAGNAHKTARTAHKAGRTTTRTHKAKTAKS